MPRPKKYGLTNPSGNDVKADPKETDRKARERVKQRFQTEESPQMSQESSQSIQPSTQTSSLATTQSIEAYSQGLQIAQSYGIKEIPLQGLLGSDPYNADGSSPELSGKEANERKLKIQRQFNAEEVRGEKLKLGRKIVQNATEETRLIGDVVGYHTAKIEVGTKVVQNQVAEVKFRTEQSRLEETAELFTQQTIRTQGTVGLTQGVREEQELKFQQQQAKNAALRLAVEGSMKDNENRRLEIEAKILAY